MTMTGIDQPEATLRAEQIRASIAEEHPPGTTYLPVVHRLHRRLHPPPARHHARPPAQSADAAMYRAKAGGRTRVATAL